MILYRLAKCIYIHDFSGAGAQRYGGRWNSVGRPMVYLAASRALAVLEVLVHLPPTLLPGSFCLAEVEIPGSDIQTLAPVDYPKHWQDISPPLELKKLGDEFLKQRKYLLLKVPSIIVPKEFNYLFNPLHPAASALKVLIQQSFNFDERLIKPPTTGKSA